MCVYFLFLWRDSCFYPCQWRDFFYFEETLFLFGATFFHSARLFFIQGDFFLLGATFLFGATFFYSARLFLFGATFFHWRDFFLFGATFFIRRDFFTMARLFAVAHFLIAGSNTCLKQYFSNMAEIAVEVENDLEKASI